MNISRHIVLGIVVLSTLVLVALQAFYSFNQNNGHLIYALDDPYIHMQVARNLMEHGIWGVNPSEFSSSSSSILYTLLIYFVFLITGLNQYVPLIINILAAVGMQVALFRMLFKHEEGTLVEYVGYALIVFLAPVGALIFGGMEHTLQILINLVYVSLAAKVILKKSPKYAALLVIFSLFCVGIRFEGIFLVASVSLLLFLNRGIKLSLLNLLSGASVYLIFGFISLANGSYFLPNSLLLKGEKPVLSILGLMSYAFVWLEKLYATPYLLVIFLVTLLVFFIRFSSKKVWDQANIVFAIFLLTTIAHFQFAKTGWFYRYDAYLVVIGLYSLLYAYKISKNHKVLSSFIFSKLYVRLGACLIILLVAYPLLFRSVASVKETPVYMKNIYEQQFQMAGFIHEFYQNGRIAANDIGAITYFNNISLVDVYGLGSVDIVKMKVNGTHDREHLRDYIKNLDVDVIMIYDDWLENKIPEEWIKVGSWSLSDNVFVLKTVSFYAPKVEKYQKLKESLKRYSKKLPSDVIQEGIYQADSEQIAMEHSRN